MATAKQQASAQAGAQKAPSSADKVRIKFVAEEQHVLVVDPKTKVSGGKTVEVTREQAEFLVANRFAVEIVDGTKLPVVWPNSDSELDAVAVKVGLVWPAAPVGRTSLSIEEKVAALEAAGHTPESVAAVE